MFKPQYNICKYAGSTLGRKHSQKTIAKLKAVVLTEEQRAKHKLGIKNQDPIHRINRIERLRRVHADPYLQALLLARLIKFNATLKLINSIKVEVIDTLNNKTSEYPSLTEAAKKNRVFSKFYQ